MTEPTWKHYLTDYNEGLGLVYERFVLNDFLLYLKGQYGFQTVLEAPLFGMAGVSGINSAWLARVKCTITLADDNPERLSGVERIWGELGLPVSFTLQFRPHVARYVLVAAAEDVIFALTGGAAWEMSEAWTSRALFLVVSKTFWDFDAWTVPTTNNPTIKPTANFIFMPTI